MKWKADTRNYKMAQSKGNQSKNMYIRQWLLTSKSIGKRMRKAGYLYKDLKGTTDKRVAEEGDTSDTEVSLNFDNLLGRDKLSQHRLNQLCSKEVEEEKQNIKGGNMQVRDSGQKDLAMEAKKNKIRALMGNSDYIYHEDNTNASVKSVRTDWGAICEPKATMQNELDHDHGLWSETEPKLTSASAPGSYTSNDVETQEMSEEDEEAQDGNQSEEPNVEEIALRNELKQDEIILADYRKKLKEKDQTVVFDLFELLITKMSQVQETVCEMKIQQRTVSTKIESLQGQITEMKEQMIENSDNMDEITDTAMQLMQVAIKHDEQISNVEAQSSKLERAFLKGCFVVTGIKETKDEDAISVITAFFSEKLEITSEVPIMSAHRIGKGAGKRALWFRLTDPDDVGTIFKHVKNLKDKTNEDNENFGISEQLIEKDREKKSRQQDIIMQNRRMPVSHQLTVERKKGEIEINGERYEKQVSSPQVKEVLLLTKEDKTEVEDVQVHQAGFKSHERSSFYSYAARAKCLEDVKKVYLKLKAEHLNASHIIRGYRFFHANIPMHQDFSDDGEYGGGRKILEALQQSGAFNLCVFVVRMKEGLNIGPIRFQIIGDLARDAISSMPGSLDYGQSCGRQDRELLSALKKVAVRPSKTNVRGGQQRKFTRGRGNNRGRGGRR